MKGPLFILSIVLSVHLSAQYDIPQFTIVDDEIRDYENLINHGRDVGDSTIFHQIFTQQGQLKYELIRLSDTLFQFREYYIMDHLQLIKKIDWVGIYVKGYYSIGHMATTDTVEGYSHETFELQKYIHTQLEPCGKWMAMDRQGYFMHRIPAKLD